MVRRLDLENGNLIVNENEIKGALERSVMPLEPSGKKDIPDNALEEKFRC